MSCGPAAQSQNGSPHSAEDGVGAHLAASPLTITPTPVIPSKRSDDDVQFISSKPVKRQKVTETRYQSVPPPALYSHPEPQAQIEPHPHLAAVPSHSGITGREQNMGLSHDRRVSTGMVGLPSDIQTIESAYANRGVSLPVLESFVLNQPSGRPRPPSSPSLSPKQLPQTVFPALLNVNKSQFENANDAVLGSLHSTVCLPSINSLHAQGVTRAPVTPVDPSPMVLTRPLAPTSCPSPTQTAAMDKPKSSMLPPLLSQTQQSDGSSDCMRLTSPPQQSTSPFSGTRPPGPRQPCPICLQMTQRAALARPQGLPMPVTNHKLSQHIGGACHSPHPHPQLMPMPPTSMHNFGPGFPPTMIPMHMNGFHNMVLQNSMPLSQEQSPTKFPSKPTQPQTSAKAMETNQATPTTPALEIATPSSPFNPLATLIQPTYRKPSPNLIVDVAETCQEKFPFEEVAKRHNTSVERVIDVFAAIIQVPLLRCPTDRRRPGRLATGRVKEYTKAKKDIQEANGGNSAAGGSKEEIVVRPLQIAQQLGPLEVPEDLGLLGRR
ncbi:hypothetical protein BJ170DRAFT_680454 [Xylariales sp. AK1849]|nr:hypothetical protein BJ170DRAFT_680454 [Xylariales sp. AK1849]